MDAGMLIEISSVISCSSPYIMNNMECTKGHGKDFALSKCQV